MKFLRCLIARIAPLVLVNKATHHIVTTHKIWTMLCANCQYLDFASLPKLHTELLKGPMRASPYLRASWSYAALAAACSNASIVDPNYHKYTVVQDIADAYHGDKPCVAVIRTSTNNFYHRVDYENPDFPIAQEYLTPIETYNIR